MAAEMDREKVRTTVRVRKNLHFAASFLGTVWDDTRDPRADEALERVADMRYEYDEAYKAAVEGLR